MTSLGDDSLSLVFGILFQNFSKKKKSTAALGRSGLRTERCGVSLTLSTEQRGTQSPGLRGGAGAEPPGPGPYGFGSVATTRGRPRPRRPAPGLSFHIALEVESLVGRRGSGRGWMLCAGGSEGRTGSRQRHTWSAHSWALAPYCGQQRQSVREATLGSRRP